MAAPREDKRGRSLWDIRRSTLQGELGGPFMCTLVVLKRYFKHILRLNARLFPFPSPPIPVMASEALYFAPESALQIKYFPKMKKVKNTVPKSVAMELKKKHLG